MKSEVFRPSCNHHAIGSDGPSARLASRAILFVAVVLTVGLAGVEPAEAGPITFDAALPVPQGDVVLRNQVVLNRASSDPTGADRTMTGLMVPTTVAYGLHSRVTFMGMLPFAYKRLEMDADAVDGADNGRVTRTTSGFGDMRAMVRATPLRIDRTGGKVGASAFGGMKLPTGADSEHDEYGRFPQPFQLGTGSWDPVAGAVFTWTELRWQFDVSGAYHLRTEANDFEAGDEIEGNASFQYRIVPWGQLESGTPNWLKAVLETNLTHAGRDRVGGEPNPDSGGLTWEISPGLQWITTGNIVEASVQIPVVQRLNGDALGGDFRARVSLRSRF